MLYSRKSRLKNLGDFVRSLVSSHTNNVDSKSSRASKISISKTLSRRRERTLQKTKKTEDTKRKKKKKKKRNKSDQSLRTFKSKGSRNLIEAKQRSLKREIERYLVGRKLLLLFGFFLVICLNSLWVNHSQKKKKKGG